MDNCFGCVKSEHKVRDSPYLKGKYKGSCKAQASDSNDALKKNLFYALYSKGEQETSPM